MASHTNGGVRENRYYVWIGVYVVITCNLKLQVIAIVRRNSDMLLTADRGSNHHTETNNIRNFIKSRLSTLAL